MSPSHRQPILRALVVAAAFACAALLLGNVGAAEARGGCAKAGAKERSDRLSLKRARRAVRCLINHTRSARNLKLNDALTKAAQRHSRKMFKKRCFGHHCPGEPDTLGRIREAGYLRRASAYRVGEVIAMNRDRASPRAVVRQWKRSGSHRAQITSGGYRHLGVGVVAKRGRAYYTATLGWRRR